jgi:hypothetical protein
MREGRTQIIQTYVGYAELLDKLEDSLAGPIETGQISSLSQVIATSDSERIEANANVSLRLEDFEDAEAIRLPLEQLMQAWKATVESGRQLVRSKGSAPERGAIKSAIERAKEQFRGEYRQAKIENGAPNWTIRRCP